MEQISSRNKILNRLGIGFFGLLLCLLAISFSKKGVYSRSLGLNMVVVGDNSVALALVRPKEDYLIWVRLPLAMRVKVDSSSAVFPVFSFWDFAKKENNPLDLVARSLSGTLGVILPSAIKINGASTPENLLGSLHSFGLNTNLTIRDRMLLRSDLVNLVSTRKTLEVDIPKSALTKKADPDGVEFLEVNSIVSLWTKNRFVFESLLGESPNLSVFNLSKTAGKGLLLSRQLESSGVRVVQVDSKYPDQQISGSGCSFRSESEFVYTEYLLEKFVNCKRLPSDKNKSANGEGIEVWIF